MATDPSKRKHGTMPCEGQRCSSHERKIPVVVFINKHDTLSYSCDWCGRSPYAKKGTGQHDEWQHELTQFAAPAAAAPAEKVTPVAKPVPAPEPEKKKGGLSWMA